MATGWMPRAVALVFLAWLARLAWAEVSGEASRPGRAGTGGPGAGAGDPRAGTGGPETPGVADDDALLADDACGAEGAGEAPCDLTLLQRRGRAQASRTKHSLQAQEAAFGNASSEGDCHTAEAGEDCYGAVMWAMSSGIRQHPEWYPGLTPQSPFVDFQKHLAALGGAESRGCGKPCKGGPASLHRPGTLASPMQKMLAVTSGMAPPSNFQEYNGVDWPTMKIAGVGEKHIFAIGDWGGLAGILPHNSQIIQYKGGQTQGPHPMGRYRVDAKTHNSICSTPEMANCYGVRGEPFCTGPTNTGCCVRECGYEDSVDWKPQILVAAQLRKRAALANPDYVLNVGDNFYWGGLYGKCGDTPMSHVSDITQTQFQWIYEDIYHGPGISGKPWLSVLGNHDWGGRTFYAPVDQQIAYTWASNRWVMPAVYWAQHIEYTDLGFSVDVVLIDSNIEDALADPTESVQHNICGSVNEAGMSCSSIGGVPGLKGCHQWFQDLWDTQAVWLQKRLAKSEADWQILVTHFPCGHKAGFYRDLHEQYGLDLMVTGHMHFQHFYWDPGRLGGMQCIITGGGGGISSENPVDMSDTEQDHQYGYFDLTISKSSIFIELINWGGHLVRSETVYPK